MSKEEEVKMRKEVIARTPVISSVARNLVFSMRSDPAEISPSGRDDSGGRPR